jgi:CDP-paratose synthetase
MERLLITGATGFIGQHLLPEIIKQLPEIKILTLNRHVDKAAAMFPFKQCKHIEGLPTETIREFNPEIAIHLATLNGVDICFSCIKPMIDTNITFGTELLNILGDCPDFKLFVNTGSFSEYASGTGQIDDAYLYAATKSAFRVLVSYYSRVRGFNYITATLYTVYGGKPTVKRLMDYLIASINAENPVPMTGGEQILDFIHVNDVVSFFVRLLNHPAPFESLHHGEEFHLGTGTGTSIRELASLIEDIMGKKCNIQWGGRPYREQDIMYAVAPTSKNRSGIDWQANISLKEGLSTLIHY